MDLKKKKIIFQIISYITYLLSFIFIVFLSIKFNYSYIYVLGIIFLLIGSYFTYKAKDLKKAITGDIKIYYLEKYLFKISFKKRNIYEDIMFDFMSKNVKVPVFSQIKYECKDVILSLDDKKFPTVTMIYINLNVTYKIYITKENILIDLTKEKQIINYSDYELKNDIYLKLIELVNQFEG